MPGAFPGADGVRAAIVAHVHSDRLVNLCVIDANGGTHSRTAIPLVQPKDDVPGKGVDYCVWMPYQIALAAKCEELERRKAAAG